MLANRSGRACEFGTPRDATGVVLPADSVQDLKNSSDLVLHDERIRHNLVSVFYTEQTQLYLIG